MYTLTRQSTHTHTLLLSFFQTWYAQTTAKPTAKPKASEATHGNAAEYQVRIMSLCKKNKAQGKQTYISISNIHPPALSSVFLFFFMALSDVKLS